jgi:hypothetical protein
MSNLPKPSIRWNDEMQQKLSVLLGNKPPHYGEVTLTAIYRGGQLVRVETWRKEASQIPTCSDHPSRDCGS